MMQEFLMGRVEQIAHEGAALVIRDNEVIVVHTTEGNVVSS
jgi:hypothetical protein